VLHAKPQPIGPWSCCSTHLHGISDPPALLLCPTRAVLPQTPTPQNCSISVGQALKAGDPQTFMISARPHTPGACTALHDLCQASPPRPAQSCRNSVLLGLAPSPALSLLCWPCPRPAQPCKISALTGHAPKVCHTRDTNMHDFHSAGPRPQGWHSPAGTPFHWAGLPSHA
jgi:hypothetical protein